MEIRIVCSSCGVEGDEYFSNARITKIYNRYLNRSRNRKSDPDPDHPIRKDWCKSCCKKLDDERKAKRSDSLTKVLTCPDCGFSGDYSSGLWKKNRYLMALKTLQCKICYAPTRKKYKHSSKNKLIDNQRNRLRTLVSNHVMKRKSKKTLDLIGCTRSYLYKHLESQFDDKMTWDNYGTYWHIDHIIPIAAFNLDCSYHQKICFNYKNLQPLEAK